MAHETGCGPLHTPTAAGLACIHTPGSVARCGSRVGDGRHREVSTSRGTIADGDRAVDETLCLVPSDVLGLSLDEAEGVSRGLRRGRSTARSS